MAFRLRVSEDSAAPAHSAGFPAFRIFATEVELIACKLPFHALIWFNTPGDAGQ